MIAVIGSCQEDGILKAFSLSSGTYLLLASFAEVFPGPGMIVQMPLEDWVADWA